MSLVTWLNIIKALWPFVHELILDGQGQPSVRKNNKLKAFIVFLMVAAAIDFFFTGFLTSRGEPRPEPKPPIVSDVDTLPVSMLDDRLKALERRISDYQAAVNQLELDRRRVDHLVEILHDRQKELNRRLERLEQEEPNRVAAGKPTGVTDESLESLDLYQNLIRLRGIQ